MFKFMKTKTKGQKISTSLKYYHKHKKSMSDVKALAGVILTIATVSILIKIFMPMALADDTARYNFLPQNKDRQEMTNTYKIMVEATKQCNKRKLGEQCVNDIMAMSWVESRHNPQTIGDRGGSHGILQICQHYHPEITQAQAENIEFAIDWTLNRLLHYGWGENRDFAVMKHNGTPYTKNTLNYLVKVNNY